MDQELKHLQIVLGNLRNTSLIFEKIRTNVLKRSYDLRTTLWGFSDNLKLWKTNKLTNVVILCKRHKRINSRELLRPQNSKTLDEKLHQFIPTAI